MSHLPQHHLGFWNLEFICQEADIISPQILHIELTRGEYLYSSLWQVWYHANIIPNLTVGFRLSTTFQVAWLEECCQRTVKNGNIIHYLVAKYSVTCAIYWQI